MNSRSTPGVGKTASAVAWYFGSQSAEQAKQYFGMVHQAFPDLHAEVHDVIAEGELVAARVTYTGTHQASSSASPQPGSRPPPTGSICSGSRTAGRLSTGAGRIRSASSCSLASCPDRPPQPSVPALRKIGFRTDVVAITHGFAGAMGTTASTTELNSDRRHKSGRERPAIAVHRRIGVWTCPEAAEGVLAG